jgi:hypothetical protein
MSLTRRNRPSDESNRTADRGERQRGRHKANLQNSDEVNRNEERTTPSGKQTGDQQRNQTTGSNVPGAEMADRKTMSGESMKQTSRDQYPKSGKSHPGPDTLSSQGQWDQNTINRSGQVYTGNSERTGQQYSEEGNSSRRMDEINKSPQQRKDQLDKSHVSDRSDQQGRKSKTMNSPGTQLNETAEGPGRTSSARRDQEHDDKNREC